VFKLSAVGGSRNRPTDGDDFLSFEKYDWRFTSSDSELLKSRDANYSNANLPV
jgi:hypothetical protein